MLTCIEIFNKCVCHKCFCFYFMYIWITSWGGWEEILFPAAQYFPIFVFVIFRRVGNFVVRRDSNVHWDTLVRSWLSLTDGQTNARLENFSKLNWTKHIWDKNIYPTSIINRPKRSNIYFVPDMVWPIQLIDI